MPIPLSSARYSRSYKRSMGFTLVELLCVIGIIASLVAIIFPVFHIVREKSRRVVCASNLRNIGVALSLYLQDYDGRYPYAIDNLTRLRPFAYSDAPWFPKIPDIPSLPTSLDPYTRNNAIFRCPSDTGVYREDGGRDFLPSRFDVLGMSYHFAEWIGLNGYTESYFESPASQYYATDAIEDWHSYRNAPYWDLQGNVLFLDGHVKCTSHPK